MKRISLTGATGFIGWNLLNALVKRGYTVKALYRPGSCQRPPELPGVEWIAGSLDDPGSLKCLVAGSRAVIHCAGSVRGN
jgi:nucleoside-diphosphate-sugar epimerase